MMNKVIMIVAGLLAATVSHADMFVNDHTDHEDNNNTVAMNDLGWHSKEFWTGGGHSLTNFGYGWSDGAQAFGVAQTISVSDSGPELTLSFDWTPAAGATSNASLVLNVQLVGWAVTNGVVESTDEMFLGMNFAGTTVGSVDVAGGAQVVDFLTGNVPWIHPSGAAYPGSLDFSSAAGVTTNVSITVGTAIGAYTDLSDYDYVGARFKVVSNGDVGNVGATIQNITLSAIPEPSSLALSLGGLTILLLRRRFSR